MTNDTCDFGRRNLRARSSTDRLSCQQARQLLVCDGTPDVIDLTSERERAGFQAFQRLAFRVYPVKLSYSFIDRRKPKIKPFDFSTVIGFGLLPNRLSPHDRPPFFVTPA
ncbi:hypothetical protein [Afipia sp. GAS231]|uniref:hypothetical protein n=1 Tax=Afipia sp. GAS231 TaxID=1882747 RepID=UPI0012F7B980|nr:hypothetical protein [Afipia sp. GAS231]